MSKTNEVAVVSVSNPRDLVIGAGQDLLSLSLEERLSLWKRQSEAQASDTLDPKMINTELVATHIHPYSRPVEDQETLETINATYVAFVLDTGEMFKTASSQALPFALEMAKFLGVNRETGQLAYPVKFKITQQKAPGGTGMIFRFVFLDIVR